MKSAVAVKDSTQRLLRRRFISYSIRQNESGLFELVDNYEELDRITMTYVVRQDVFQLPEELHATLHHASIDNLIGVCNSTRKELELTGLKMFFDPGQGGELRPKWRYRVGGQTKTDYMQVAPDNEIVEDAYNEHPNQVPDRIMQLVRRNYQYHTTSEWKVWFGRKMQRKREEIILNILQQVASQR